MAKARATTPGRGATPARGMTPGADRQRTTTPSVTMACRPTISSAQNGLDTNMSTNMANEWRPRLVGDMSVNSSLSKHARRSPPAFGLSSRDSLLRADLAQAQARLPNYAKLQPEPKSKHKPTHKPNPKPQIPNSSSPMKSKSKRVTRQGDGTLPGAPDRLIDDAATLINEPKKVAAKGKTAKTGFAVAKPKVTAKRSAAKLFDFRSSKAVKVGKAATTKKVSRSRI